MPVDPIDVCRALVDKARLLRTSSPFMPEIAMATEAIRTATRVSGSNATVVMRVTIYVIECIDDGKVKRSELIGARWTEWEAKLLAEEVAKASSDESASSGNLAIGFEWQGSCYCGRGSRNSYRIIPIELK
jgi:hypothetical protein